MLDEFGLINMNARLYDPKLGRMLSVDNYVSDAGSALAYNRYSYANCNPISYVDPDGNHPVLIAMAIGAAISAATYTAQAAFSPGGLQRNFHFGDFATSTFFGAVIGGVTAGVGQAFGPTWVVGTSLDNGKVITLSMALTHEAGRAAAHGGLNALFSFGQGGNPLVGFVSGTVSTLASHGLVMGKVELGDVGGAFFSMGVGAGSSYLSGGNPWIGAGAALMSYTLNQLAHKAITVRNTREALNHYFRGRGEPVRLDNKTVRSLLNSKKFIEKHGNIVSGRTKLQQGNFSVNMTSEVFHVGRTNVEYSIWCGTGECSVVYKIFANDGFYDVDFIDEMLGTPDGLGPNLERFGGIPYMYEPVYKTYFFPNPGYESH